MIFANPPKPGPLPLRWLLTGLLCLGPGLFAGPGSGPPEPRIWLWAWDRPEDLRFLGPRDAGVAMFVLGIRVEARGLSLRHRTAPLRLSPGMRRIAVVRLEVVPRDLDDRRLGEVVAAIRTRAQVPGTEGIQVDFDATRSQRPLYRRLLAKLRGDPAIRVPVTMTALASWCMGDRWIADLPVEGAVAMLFQMGQGTAEALAWLRRGRPLGGPAGTALDWGISTDQPLPAPPPATARVFVFHPLPWTPAAYGRALFLVKP